MRKTNLALFVAVVVSSPIALADGGYGGHDDDGSITVTDSFNDKYIDKDTVTINKDLKVKDSFNSDDDKLILHDVKNDKSYKYTDNSDHSSEWTDNSTTDYSQDWQVDIEKNYFVADSYLDGSVTYSDVTYGGGGAGGGHHGGDSLTPNTVMVTQSNDMTNAFSGASGINMAAQNAGNNSLVQQSASTNAILSGQ